ncbi:MAG: hypothetical protein QF541_07990 [Lentisphaeria bacterium]|nr:hypothetical protein [Lentisphaeria bacterium]
MSPKQDDVICCFGNRHAEPLHTQSLCPARECFSRIDQRELVFDLGKTTPHPDADFPAVMCGDLGLSGRGVESLHFRLPREPGFYRIEFGFLNLTHKQIVDGDNCKYAIAKGDTYDGRMKEANAQHYIRYHDDQLEAAQPEVVLGFDEIDEMDHQPHYARVEILLDSNEIAAFELGNPVFVRDGGNRFVPEIFSRTIAITTASAHTLTVRTVNRFSPLYNGRGLQWGTIITEDFCPTFFSLTRAEAPVQYNPFLREHPGASEIDCWGWEQVISYQRTRDDGVRDFDNPVEVGLDYVKATNTEAYKRGSNLLEVYWVVDHRRENGETLPGHVIEWEPDDPVEGAELYARYPRTAWNNEMCRELTRASHQLGMLVTWYQHLPSLKTPSHHAPGWFRSNFVEVVAREFADLLEAGWRGTLDCYEEESANGADSIQWLVQCHRQWQYNPGMAVGETSDKRSKRHEKGILPGGLIVETNTYFINDRFVGQIFPFECDESEYGVQGLILQANSRAVGFASTARRGIGEPGGPAAGSPDGILQQANDFFRPRFRDQRHFPRHGIWWLGPAENLLPEWMRDYVYGISNDPVRAAVTTELAATGVGGVLDSATTYWPTWCRARYDKPASTKFIGNNHLRLYRDADADRGGLAAELEGLGDFSIHGPALDVAGDLFRLCLMEGATELKVNETVSHRYLEAAGHIAVLEETVRLENAYLDLAIQERRRYEIVSDSPFITVEIDRETIPPENRNESLIQAYKRVCHSLDLSGYDRLRDLENESECPLVDGSSLVVEDSRGILPALFVAVVEGATASSMTARFPHDRKLRLFTSANADRIVIRIGTMTSWLTAEHLPWLSGRDGFAAAAVVDVEGTVENPEARPVVRKVRVRSAGSLPYFVCERGYWSWRGAQPSREHPGDDFLKVYLDGQSTARIVPDTFLDGVVKPGWGSQYQLSIADDIGQGADVVSVGVRVRSVNAAVFAPRLLFQSAVASVKLDGEPWYYFDEDIVFLPNREGEYRLEVKYGEASTPRLLASFGVPSEFEWDGSTYSFRLDLPPFSHRLPKSVYLYGAVRTGGAGFNPGAGIEIVRETADGLVFRCKPGPVVLASR